MISGRTIYCDYCGASYRFGDVFDCCYDESELQDGPIEGRNPVDMFVDVSQGWGQETLAEHWCLDCWDRNTAPPPPPPRRWRVQDAPLLYRLYHDEDYIRTCHLKVADQPYVW